MKRPRPAALHPEATIDDDNVTIKETDMQTETIAKDDTAVTTIAPTTTPEQARRVFATLERELNVAFAEREKEIRGVLVALVAREHVLLLGPAGTGKSALAHTVCSAIDGANYFQWLLTRFSTPEEIFGPVSLDGLKHDRFRRVTHGKLPEATIGFLDEVYKANSAVLNSLLTALNERAFDNDGGRHQIPLETLIGASNELAEGPELAALHDRFLLRYWTQYTKTPDAFTRLLTGDEPRVAVKLTLGGLAAAQAAAEALPVSSQTVAELFKLRGEMASMGISASDRRWRKAVRILRAEAWLSGAAEVSPEAFPVLANVFWETTDQVAKLTTLVARYASAEQAEAQEIHDSMMELVAGMPDKKQPDFSQKVVSLTRELKKGIERISTLKKAAGSKTAREKIESLQEAVAARYKAVRATAAEALDL